MVYDRLLLLVFAALPQINPTSEFLEGEQLEQQRGERGGAHGARESGGSVHCHAHRHGLYRDDVGGGKRGVTARRAAMNAQ